MFHPHSRRFQLAGLIAAFGHLAADVQAHPITAAAIFRLDCPNVYVVAGLELNPAIGAHPFVLPAPVCIVPPDFEEWSPPTTLVLAGGSVSITGSCTHLVALHAGEAAPSTTFPTPPPYTFSRALPAGGFYAVETRVRARVLHPGGPHNDEYMVVVGALKGTVPGASLASRFVIIGGSIGKHLDNPPPPAPQPIYGGATLVPSSGLPAPGTQDFPAGEVLALVDMATLRLTMFAIVDGIQGASITNVFVRQGPNGPNLMDLRPQMQMKALDQFGSSLAVSDAIIPAIVAQTIANGNAYISVTFPPALHPDGQILGQITPVHCKAGDANCNGSVNIDDLLAVINGWGACPPPCPPPANCPGDVNGDCVVNIDDLLLAINNWG